MDEAGTIRAAERAVWEALRTGDAAADARLLADDFLGVYPDGFAGPAAHAGQLAHGPTVASYAITEEHLRPMGPDYVLYAYRADYTRTAGAEPEAMLVSSIWQCQGGTWLNIFSQDTPLTGAGVP
ncbi:nuclear transport factor 2 family protein [Roseibacterium sp. SDUM158016]|uniref:nuclear transport factor 2 family protein n=1 Tax=Roseicyclus sediminis TaxID=2980997 RepID=UPI0021D0EC7D|nr:nuclear transport factor 2 family protein [Roseibacterium sp. SDUM158016]MCU4654548.1 nuclear transport factor 2 family protein [Roseibacterium sp. SDUM158016]